MTQAFADSFLHSFSDFHDTKKSGFQVSSQVEFHTQSSSDGVFYDN